MILKFKKKSIKVSTYAEASDLYCAARDKSGQGASRWPSGELLNDAGVQIAIVSYNGKIWSVEDHAKAGNDPTKYSNPLFNPYAD